MDGEVEQSNEGSSEQKPKISENAEISHTPQNEVIVDLKEDNPMHALERLASGNPEIVARTFAEAKARPKGFSDEFITGLLTGTLKSPDGTNAMFVKVYLDQVMSDQEEFELSHTPDRLADMHDGMVDMISDNLKIGIVDGDEKTRSYFVSKKQQYLERLRADSKKTRDMLVKYKAGDIRAFNPAYAEYHGLTINTAEGEIDVSGMGSKKVKGVRPNIRIQRELANQFIHWETDQMMRDVQGGHYPELAKRIYLNPKTSNSVQIFTELMQTLNSKGLSAKGKVLDRSYELMGQMGSEKPQPIRADEIVLYMQEGDADGVLETVLSKYSEKPELFADRPTPKVPTKIAPGIAVGDEPAVEGASLTSHRADVIEAAASKTKSKLGMSFGDAIDPSKSGLALSEFRKTFKEIAVENNINPNNMAFNYAN